MNPAWWKDVLARAQNLSPRAVMAISVALAVLVSLGIGGGLLLSRHHPTRHTAAGPASPATDYSPQPLPTDTPGITIPVSSTVVIAQSNYFPARVAPNATAKVVIQLHHHNLIGQESPLLVTATVPGWYDVLLPIRPNGASGWVAASDVRVETVPDFLVASLSSFRLDHYMGGKLMESFPIAVGAAATPTPTGLFYLDAIQQDPGPPYDPVIFALSAYSPTLTDWPLGGIVGIHGWSDPSVEGQAVSNGCLRMHPADAGHLEGELQLGVPIDIVA